MDKDILKLYLVDNLDKLKELLESIGLVHIRRCGNRYYTCGFPTSKRRDSIQVFFNDSVSVKVWNRNDKIEDIYALIRYQLECGFIEAINIVADICNIETNYKIRKIDMIKRKPKKVKKEYSRPKSKILNEKFNNLFVKGECKIFTKDGISEETQKYFGVKFDALENRVVFPIRDYDGNLLTYKGRTLEEKYIEKGIPKYLYYHSFNGRYYLFGYYENYWDIMDSDYLIVGESEKMPMQLYTNGIKYCVATSKKRISEEQAIELNKLNKKIVLAYDNDVTEEEIINECRKLKGEVYYIKDRWGLLDKKDSPIDKGVKVWEFLYKNKIKYER